MSTRMKMAAAFVVWVLLICCSASSSADECTLFGIVEHDVTVPLKQEFGSGIRLKWKHYDKTVFNLRDGKVTLGKKEDINTNGSLLLKSVRQEQGGKYQAEVHDKQGIEVGISTHFLCFTDPVKKPNITVECPATSVKFTCEANQDKGSTIRWYQNDKLLEKEKAKSITRQAESVKNDMFKCSVSNPVSEKYSDPVKQTCRGIVDFLEEYMFILVGVGGGVVLLLFIMVIICCIKAKRRRHMHVKDEEELRLGWTNPNQHHHHHHHHPNQQHHHHHHHRQQQKQPQPQQQQKQPQHQQQHQQQQQQQQRQQQRQQPAGHTGPRPHRTKQQRQRHPDPPGANAQPSPRRPPQAPPAADEDQPPPLPQPRKKAPKTPQV